MALLVVLTGEQYDAANKLTSRDGFSYAYDDEGRTVSRTETSTGKVTRFGWGQGGQLRSVTLPSGDVTRYRYDPLGRRVESAAPGRTRVQVYGVDPNAVAESSGGVETRFTFGVGYDAPLAMQGGGVASFFAQDALSSVTSLTNSSGAVSGRYSYDTYGQIKASSGTTASPYTYTGREWDSDAGIYDYRARQYDPATGRFLSEVPIATSNLYAYAAGVPTLLFDRNGSGEVRYQPRRPVESRGRWNRRRFRGCVRGKGSSLARKAGLCDDAARGERHGLGSPGRFRTPQRRRSGSLSLDRGRTGHWGARSRSASEGSHRRISRGSGGSDHSVSASGHALASAAVINTAVEIGRGLLDPDAACG